MRFFFVSSFLRHSEGVFFCGGGGGGGGNTMVALGWHSYFMGVGWYFEYSIA